MKAVLLFAILLSSLPPSFGATTIPPKLDPLRSPSTDGFYPDAMKAKDIQGAVVVSVCVNADSQLLGAPEVAQTSGFPDLDAAAVSWASKSAFKAGSVDGKPTALCTRLRVKFEITGTPVPTEPSKVSAYIDSIVAESQKTGPQDISSDLRVTSVRKISEKTIEYTYSFKNLGNTVGDEARINTVAENIENNTTSALCAPEAFGRLIDATATVLVAFEDSKGRGITTLTLDKDFCTNALTSAKKRQALASTAGTQNESRPIVLLRAPSSEDEARIQWVISPSSLQTKASHLVFSDFSGQPFANVSVTWLQTLLTVHERLAAATGVSAPCLAVSSNAGINAFASLSEDKIGCIGFTLGMLEFLQNDSSQVAAVMAHELGHVKFRHTGRNDRQATASLLGSLLGAVVGGQVANQIASTLASQATQYATRAVVFSFDRDQERQADAFAVEALEKAGFDRDAFSKFMRRLSVREGANDGGLFSTHPSYEERLKRTTQ
jgi:putative metalloprotease